ncbi:neo-calmodulin-like [Babylonia areolata]|uniref:neo-calmodulin-like n=1 Tax=Babylonia areolata TaxID=304850 RepID=UPI003FD36EA9
MASQALVPTAQRTRMEEYKAKFKEADVNGDGYLSLLEFTAMMRTAGSKLTDRQIAETFLFFDGPCGDRRISFEEFCTGCNKIEDFVQRVTLLFHELDVSGDGQLQKEELRTLAERSGRTFSPQELDSIFRQADTNGDHALSLQEFLHFCM